MSSAERKWLSCNNRSEKIELKSQYDRVRKQFDTEVQKEKRRHWHSIQEELIEYCNVDQSKFWKSIGKISIGYSKKNIIPNEITALFRPIILMLF